MKDSAKVMKKEMKTVNLSAIEVCRGVVCVNHAVIVGWVRRISLLMVVADCS